MPEPDIEIKVGAEFTTARVEDRTVAMLWGRDREFFVTDGRGAPIHCGSREEATRHLMRFAMAGKGVATVVQTAEAGSLVTEPTDEMVHAAQAATCGAESDECMRAAVRAALAIHSRGSAVPGGISA